MLSVNLETNQDTLAASCYSLEYANNYMRGLYAPHYPVPCTEFDGCIAMPAMRITFRVKKWLLEYVANNGYPRRMS